MFGIKNNPVKEQKKREKEQAEQERLTNNLLKQSFKVKAEYMGGHKSYLYSRKTDIYFNEDNIVIKNPDLTIPFKEILNITNMDEERITTARILLTGPLLGLLWKKQFLYTVIEYFDGLVFQNVIIDFGDDIAEDVQHVIYERMRNKKLQQQKKQNPQP
ncbi:MAG: hypothetical protein ACRD8W_17570 [Nitrososphaeraceae archaeon]